jgi:CBS domain-containing protein
MEPSQIASAQPITSIMRTKLLTSPPDASVEHVLELLRDRHIGCVPIIDQDRRPLGLVTKLDVLETLGENRKTAREIMMPHARSLEASATVAEVAKLMSAERIHHVLVVDADRALIGIVSSLDLAGWIAGQGA